ncbi:epidermal growth factor receptor kinase substrate 8-like protein 1 isoform X2 [Rhinoraja longicauda]
MSSRSQDQGGTLQYGEKLLKPSGRSIYEQRKKYSNTNFIMEDRSQYHVNHLATFPLGPGEETQTVDESIKKLKNMDSKGRIWTQDMLLQVNTLAVSLVDIESKEELEKYPLLAIERCESLLDNWRYNSILILVSQEAQQTKPDVHFFQCSEVGADLIKSDINAAITDMRSGRAERPSALRLNQERINEQNSPSPPLSNSPSPKLAPKAPITFNPLITSQGSSSAPPSPTGTSDLTEGLLTLRARPPSQEDFVETFQKYKYSFSLLARVKNHIVNPNATELVHFLFGPLDSMVQTAGADLASSVSTPFLTNDAVHLLTDTLNETESTLWQSLGDYWTKPRLEWPPDQWEAPYTIPFRSGWVPDQLDPNGTPWDDPVELQHKHEIIRMQQSGPQTVPIKLTNGDHEAPQKMRCSYDFMARNSSELSVLSGEVVEVLDNSKRWWKVGNQSGQVGYVPFNILEPLPAPGTADNTHLYAQVTPKESRQKAKGTPPPTAQKKVTQVNSHPIPWDAEALGVTQTERERNTQVNVMNEELLLRIASGRTSHPKSFHVPRTLDTSVPLDYTSSPGEVATWLQAKGFNQTTVNSLGILTGAQLFSLEKEELRSVSPEEGARVYSQIMVHKALLEKTRSTTELEAIMQKQKRKVDSEIKMSTL